MDIKRENNIDFLKIISAIFVIMTHVSASWVVEYLTVDSYKFSIGNFYDSLSRIAVPLFVMIAGRYALSYEKNRNSREYYKKIFKRIYIPTIIWSILYMIRNFIISGKEINFWNILKVIILGNPHYHLWYLYMMIGIYLLVPFFIRVKNKYGERRILKIGIIFILIGLGITIFKDYLEKINFYERRDALRYFKYYWSFNQFRFLKYIGYFILGYSLKNLKISKKKLIVIYILSLFSTFIIVEKTRNLFFYENCFIFTIIGAISFYLFFNNIKFNYKFSKLEKYTFDIYLVHVAILNIVLSLLDQILDHTPNPIWYIPFVVIIVFLFSLIFSVYLEKILDKIKQIKNSLTI